ncbi:MAG: chorismate mutase [Mycolicibacterium sp.]|uniref:chorismate mutase n=1 Tax=Mycolicibacterium sp. TaxID=2320850 RepID=UPI003D14C799
MIATARTMSRAARAAAAALALTMLVPKPVALGQSENPLVPLVDAVAQRLQVVEPVVAFKYLNGGLIQDPARDQQVLAAAAAAAAERNIQPGYVTEVFRDQIDASLAIEYTRLAQWKFDPASAPAAAPDLAASRVRIDELNRQIVNEIAHDWDVLHSPTCTAELDAAKMTVVQTRAMDPLYRQAIDVATRNYCQ